jgi:hypothetical protein
LQDLKQAILEDGLTVLVNVVVLPYSGVNSINSQPSQRPWTTVFRNTTGILRWAKQKCMYTLTSGDTKTKLKKKKL